MKLTFDPTGKTGRFIYRIQGLRRVWLMPDGSIAPTDAHRDAIAQGYVAGSSHIERDQLALIETGRDTPRAIGNAFSKWTLTATEEQYGARSPFESFEICLARHGQA